MADNTDIIQRIVIEVIDKASAVIDKVKQSGQEVSTSFQQLGQRLGQTFAPATASVQKFGQATATSFADATKSIAALGATAPEALAASAAAAIKFGASARELQTVQGVINALAARVRDGGKSFTELATNVDSARGALTQTAPSVGLFARAFGSISAGAAGAVGAVEAFIRSLTVTRAEIAAFSAAVSAMGLPFGGLISILGRVGTAFGVIGTAVLAAAGLNLISKQAADTAHALGVLADTTKESFERLSATQQVFRQLGVSAEQFTQTFQQLAQRLGQMAPDLADEWSRAADKIADAFLKVKDAGLRVQEIKLSGEQLQLQTKQIELQGRELQLQAQSLVLQRQGVAQQLQQTGLNLVQIRQQLQYSGQLYALDRQRAALTVADAAANLRMLQLKKQLRDGEISEEEFAQRMAEEEDRALNRAIQKAKVDLEAAKLAEKMLPEQQQLAQQQLELQKQQLELQLKQLALQDRQLQLDQERNQLAQQQNTIDAAKNLLDIERNLLEAQRAEIALREAQRDLLKAQANDLREIVRLIQEAAKEGKEVKFPDLTTAETKAKAFAIALQEAQKAGTPLAEALDQLLRTLPDIEKFNIGKSLGIPPEVIDAFRQANGELTKLVDTAKDLKLGFSDQDRVNLEKVRDAWNSLSGSIATAKDNLGLWNAASATADFNFLRAGINATTGDTNKLIDKLRELQQLSGGKGGSFSFDQLLFGPGGIKGAWDALKATINSIIPPKGILDLLFSALISPAGAAEGNAGDQLKQAIVEPLRAAINDAANLDTSAIARAFAGLADNIRDAIGKVDIGDAFSQLVDQARTAADAIVEAFSGIGDQVAGAFAGVGDSVGSALAGVADTINTLISTITEALGSLGTTIANAFAGVGDAIARSIVAPLQSVQTALADLVNAIVQTISNAMQQLQELVERTVQNIIASVQRAIDKIREMQSAASGGGGGGGAPGAAPFARGGLFRGRGGIDTNLALLSDGEFIVRAEAVQRYGVGLFNLLNAMTFPGFALGGLVMPRMAPVMAAIPAYAAGGLNQTQGRTFHLSFGGETFRNLIAPEEVAQALERAAINRQSTSTGVKPRWSR